MIHGGVAVRPCALGAVAAVAVGLSWAISADLQAAAPPNVVLPTLGGKQFWGDELFFHQWRIQRNVVTEHYRLLDEEERRQAWGSFEQCRARLEEIKRSRRLRPMHGRAVIVLHGLGRSRSSMDGLCKHLREQGHYTVFNVTYPSTRAEIASHAAALRRIVENLDGIEEINFVGHSMGNLVVRHYLAGAPQAKPTAVSGAGAVKDEAGVGLPDPRIQRFVMLAPPNHGSLAALLLADSELFKEIAGEPGRQLGRDWDKLQGKLATPACAFGILAGGRGDGRGFNPILPGDDDGTISVETTRLAGAADFALLPNRHTFIMEDAKAQEYTLRFLQKGYFLAPNKRQPIPAPNPKS